MRLHIPSRKGDSAYFEKVKHHLKEVLSYQCISTSPLTGCIVIEDSDVDEEKLRDVADRYQLFKVVTNMPAPAPMAKRFTAPIGRANRSITEFSGGTVDLPGILFLILLAFGMWELAIGNFKRPPWYTAFWYAFGLVSRSLYDELNSEKN